MIVVGAGAAGLVLALSLHEIGVDCRVYEAVPELAPLGVGINLLPHAVRELDQLGLLAALDARAVRTKDASYFNRFGQHIFTELAGESAGYPWPQFSIHRGDMQTVFLDAVLDRLGPDSVVTGHRCVRVEQDSGSVTAHFQDPDGAELPPVRGSILVACDGIHSAVRGQFHPDEGDPVYSGLTSYRAAAPFPPFLSGANTARIGWMDVGKLIVYPIRDDVDGEGRQLVNFVATLKRPHPNSYSWTKEARPQDWFPPFADWHFDWLDVPELLRSADPVLVFPMVDRDPLDRWTFERATLAGDAAHPMTPRGSNGAGQAILDARFLAGRLKRRGVGPAALAEYEATRLPATADVVRMNRTNPPDAILREVYERSGDKPFDDINDVIPASELRAIIDRYREVAGFDVEQLKRRPSFV
ncbi:flavin-dependent oxidoreductase [Actinophytocola sp.]|uniref:flavin-dependent oxidoreductase n=1 Tax=Actinophytocola sp. TaxID=1872138 RepID=UPI003D6C1AA2